MRGRVASFPKCIRDHGFITTWGLRVCVAKTVLTLRRVRGGLGSEQGRSLAKDYHGARSALRHVELASGDPTPLNTTHASQHGCGVLFRMIGRG